MRTRQEIRDTPFLALTEEEINTLDPHEQIWAREAQLRRARRVNKTSNSKQQGD